MALKFQPVGHYDVKAVLSRRNNSDWITLTIGGIFTFLFFYILLFSSPLHLRAPNQQTPSETSHWHFAPFPAEADDVVILHITVSSPSQLLMPQANTYFPSCELCIYLIVFQLYSSARQLGMGKGEMFQKCLFTKNKRGAEISDMFDR